MEPVNFEVFVQSKIQRDNINAKKKEIRDD